MKENEQLAREIEAKIVKLTIKANEARDYQKFEASASFEVAISNLYRALVKLYV